MEFLQNTNNAAFKIWEEFFGSARREFSVALERSRHGFQDIWSRNAVPERKAAATSFSLENASIFPTSPKAFSLSFRAEEEADSQESIKVNRWEKRDKNALETALNVVTSIPFLAVGLSTPQSDQRSIWFGRSVMAIGVMSGAYHGSQGKIRPKMRYLDYLAIAVSTTLMTHAMNSSDSHALMLGSMACAPFKPSAVTAFNSMFMEARFFNAARTDPSVRGLHKFHLASAAAGAALMVADEALPENRFLHAAWHLAAAASLLSVTGILKHGQSK